MASIRSPQNPGIGGLEELTTAEKIFLTTFAGLSGNDGQFLKWNSGSVAWEPEQWYNPDGNRVLTYTAGGDIDTITIGTVVLTFGYTGSDLSTITDGTKTKTFTYNGVGDLTGVTYS